MRLNVRPKHYGGGTDLCSDYANCSYCEMVLKQGFHYISFRLLSLMQSNHSDLYIADYSKVLLVIFVRDQHNLQSRPTTNQLIQQLSHPVLLLVQ